MKKKSSILILILSVFTFGFYLVFWNKVPNEVAIHWNVQGEVDHYGNKVVYLFLLLIPILIVIGGEFLAKIDPKKENYVKHEKTYWLLMDLMALFLLVINWLSFAYVMGMKIDISSVVPGMIGILFICIGNYLPLIKDNYFFGIRTPWTLADPIVWKKTHRLGGIIFVLTGLLMIIGILLPKELGSMISLVSILGSVLICFIYSYLCFKKMHEH